MRIETNSPVDNGLLLIGVPFAKGKCLPDVGVRLVTDAGDQLAVWWAPRAHWPDGSLKWIWLHARVPAGTANLELQVSPGTPAHGEPPVKVEGGRVAFEHEAFRFTAERQRFELSLGEMTLNVSEGGEAFEPELTADLSSASFELTEASPIAPLIRLRHPVTDGIRREYLFRIDAVHHTVRWTRRVSLLAESRHDLRRMSAALALSQGEWRIDGFEGRQALAVRTPHQMQVDDQPEVAGNPEALLVADCAAAWLEKGWQRAPFALHARGNEAVVELYPESAPPLPVLQGTSFRHDLWLAVGDGAKEAVRANVCWAWDSEAATDTGVFGPLAPRNEWIQRLFPGFDRAFQDGIEHCRPTSLDKPDGTPPGPPGDLSDESTHDVEFFGLQHYGDWPMKIGSYGGQSRMYCDNEYDVSYALVQQFARTGNWSILELARHSAIHMTDVDFLLHSGDLRYHGYSEQAEDHAAARVMGGELGHVWTDGFWCLHLLFGDPFAREAALALTERLCLVFAGEDEDTVRSHFTGCERAVGWPMVAMSATAEINNDPTILDVLEKMSRYVAKYLSNPDAEFEGIETIGGQPVQWWRCATQDGCKPFMLGVLMEGLERHHRLTGSPAAAEALVAIAKFLRDVMWEPIAGAFVYELNAYNRGHRDFYPHYINFLVTRGLAYAYELTGDEKLKQLTLDAAYGGLWTVFETTGGKEIGVVGRTGGATISYMLRWWEREQRMLAAKQPASPGQPFTFAGPPAELLARPGRSRLKGQPRFDEGGGLICDQESFAVCQIDTPWNTETGRIALDFKPNATIEWNGGGSPASGWAILHLCDERFTASAVTVMHFYDRLHVRFYDRHRKLIEVLETSIQGWPGGERRRIEFSWNPCEAALWMDGEEVHRVPMQRRLSGVFQKLYLGCKPGNWKGKGTLHRVEIGVSAREPSDGL